MTVRVVDLLELVDIKHYNAKCNIAFTDLFVKFKHDVAAYGLSIFFYIYAQRNLGAARTSSYYAIAPFIGTLLSLIIFLNMPPYTYFAAIALMAVGAWLCSSDEPIFKKKKH